MTIILSVIRVVSLLLFVTCAPVSAQYLCQYSPNLNVSSADMVAPTFAVSSHDCCVKCGDTKGCIAAVYNNYLCHVKASMGSGLWLPSARR